MIPIRTKKHLLHLFSILLLTTEYACTPTKPINQEALKEQDSLALHIAVMPTTDCMPLYVAKECGIMDSLGLDVRLHTYTAQMDVDTALLNGTVSVAYSDLIRTLRLSKKIPVKAFMGGNTPVSLVAIKNNRVSSIHQMKERMVAISRLSITDFWCNRFLDSVYMNKTDVYKPQIHDILLRTEMIQTQLLDAAILPSPYNQWMKQLGHRVLCTSSENGPHLSAWVVRDDSLFDERRTRQVKQMVEAYAIACQQIKKGKHNELMRQLWSAQFHLPQEIQDSITLAYPTSIIKIDSSAVNVAVDFMHERDSLFMPEIEKIIVHHLLND